MNSRENKSKYAILGMLSFSAKSGYEISKMIQNSTAFFWSESDGQLYPLLKRLSQEGLITQKEIKEQGQRQKKIYEITDEGMKILIDWQKRDPSTFNIRNEFLLQLFFGHNLSHTENIEKIKHYKIELLQTAKIFDAIEKQIKDHSRFPTYLLLSLSYGQKSLVAEINWCDDAITLLQQEQPHVK